jgi:hypothetical protein
MARPKTNIDLAEIEKLYGLQCTDEEAPASPGISTRTLQRRRQNKQFSEAMDRAKARAGFRSAAICFGSQPRATLRR